MRVFSYLGFAFVPVTFGLTLLWLVALARAQRAEEALRHIASGATGRIGRSDAFAQVDAKFDALAAEVQRIAEAQRFTAELLVKGKNGKLPS